MTMPAPSPYVTCPRCHAVPSGAFVASKHGHLCRKCTRELNTALPRVAQDRATFTVGDRVVWHRVRPRGAGGAYAFPCEVVGLLRSRARVRDADGGLHLAPYDCCSPAVT